MKNKLYIISLLLLFFSVAHNANAIFSTSTNEVFDGVVDDATETIKNEMGDYAKEKASQTITQIAKKIPGAVIDAIKFVSSKTLDFVRGSMNDNTKSFFSRRKDLVMEGLREEKGEFEKDVEHMLLGVWEKIKNIIKRGEKE